MGCDIHIHAEKRNAEGKWVAIPKLYPFDWRSYGMYGFLADVRNYSAVPPIAPRRGVPADLSDTVKADLEHWDSDAHSHSWLTVAELLAFNYDAEMEDRRVTRQVGPNAFNGGCTADPGEGEKKTFRDFLGEKFFEDLDRLQEREAERVVFWFDN